MELHAKLIRSQLNFFKPFVANCSLEVTRKGQDKLGELMTALHKREVLVKEHDFGRFQGAWIMPRDERRGGVVLYLHGGGYTCGSLEYAKGFAATLQALEAGRCPAVLSGLGPVHRSAAAAALHALTLAPTAEGARALRYQILRREAVNADPDTKEAALETLRTRAKELALPPVCAPESGCFAEKVPSVVSPAALQGLSPAEFLQLRPETAQGCRLITDDRWYFAALLPEARELLPGQTVTVRLTDALTVEMAVERVSTTPEGSLLVLSAREHLAEAAALGQVRARLQFSACEGLRVPKAAVQYRDGQTGVDVLVAGQVKFKPVTLLCEREDDFLAARTPGDPAALQEGDEMVVYSSP